MGGAVASPISVDREASIAVSSGRVSAGLGGVRSGSGGLLRGSPLCSDDSLINHSLCGVMAPESGICHASSDRQMATCVFHDRRLPELKEVTP